MTGPEPEYDKIVSGFKSLHYQHPFEMKYNKARLPELHVAYETWGKLNESKSNAVLIQAGLSASSHAKSHRVLNIHSNIWYTGIFNITDEPKKNFSIMFFARYAMKIF